MVLEPFIDQAARDALILPGSECERHYIEKTSELRRVALKAGRSQQETQNIGTCEAGLYVFTNGKPLLLFRLAGVGQRLGRAAPLMDYVECER